MSEIARSEILEGVEPSLRTLKHITNCVHAPALRRSKSNACSSLVIIYYFSFSRPPKIETNYVSTTTMMTGAQNSTPPPPEGRPLTYLALSQTHSFLVLMGSSSLNWHLSFLAIHS